MTYGQFAADLLGRRFWISAYAALLIGILIPGAHPEWSFGVPTFLGGILFFTGLRLPWTDLIAAAASLARWRLVGRLCVIQMLVLPLLVWAMVRAIAPDLANGVLLVALMPAGMTSIAYSDLFRGDRALSLLLLVGSSLSAPFTVPLVLQTLHPSQTSMNLVSLAGQAGYILIQLGLPLAAAQAVRAAWPESVERHSTAWGRLAVACSCILGGVAVVTTKGAWLHLGWSGLLEPLLVTCLASAVFVAAGLLSARWLKRQESVAFACAIVFMNNGLGVAFAVRFFPEEPAMLLPSVLMMAPMIAGTAIIGRCLRP